LAFASPGPLVFQLGPFALRWYGLFIAIAVLSGLGLATKLGKSRGIDPNLIADLLPVLVLGAVLGARTYYVLLEWRQYAGHWPEALAIWHGGIAIHGALLGGSLATVLYCRWRKLAFWPLLDVLLPAVALGQAIGKIEPGLVDLKLLANKRGEQEFLTDLIKTELASADRPDALIFAGPKYMVEGSPEDELKKAEGVDYPVFYMNYNLNPAAVPWRDSIGKAIRVFGGKEYTITRPRDLFFAVTEMVGRIVESKQGRGGAPLPK